MDFKLIRLIKNSDLKKIPRRKAGVIIISTQNEALARKSVERYPIDALCNLESSTGRNHTHYRRSGANQVLFNLMAEHNVGYLIDFTRILRTDFGKKRALLLGRIMQNIKIAQKKKRSVPIYISCLSEDEFEKRPDSDLKAFARVLGVNKPLTYNDLIKSAEIKKQFVSKGIRLVKEG